jgi:glycosyltransferase involved in cell wall biosynthesis
VKIVIDARESGTSTGRYIDKLVEHLHELQPEHRITVLTKAHRLAYLQQIAPQFTVLETPYKEFTFGEQLGFKRQLRSLGADLVHFGMVQQPVWYKGTTVTTIHDLTTVRFRNPAKNPLAFTIKQQVYKWVIKRAARKSSQIIVPSEFVKQDVAHYSGVPVDKITVTLESADKIADKPVVFGAAESKQYLLYVGRAQTHKNLRRLIDAFALIKQERPGLHLVLAGKLDAAYAGLQQYAGRQGISDIIFTDWVTDAQLRWLYEHALAYVFPSLSEGFGLPSLEAMQYGLPVISSNATCLPEINGEAAVYFDPLSVADMAATIRTVLTDEQLRQDLAARGQARLARYSWRRMAEQTLAVYEQALKR